MKYHQLIFLSTLLLLLLSCGRKNTLQLSDPVFSTISADTSHQISKPPPVKPLPPIAIQIVGLQKTGCYGKCPVFEYKIFNDGRVTYVGRKYAQRIGAYESRLSTQLLEQITAYAELVGFFQMPDRYPDSAKDIVDLPSTISYVKKGDQEKTVINRYDAPKRLEDFESFFMNVMESLIWKQVK